MGESPGEDLISKKSVSESWDAVSQNPFIDSEDEDDTTVCSVVEKPKFTLENPISGSPRKMENSISGSPRKRLRSCGSADSCSPLPGGSPKTSSKNNSSLNGLGSQDHSTGKWSPRPGSSSPRPDTGPGSPSRRDLLSLPLRRPTGGCGLLRTKAGESEQKEDVLTCPMCKYTNTDSERLQEHVNR